MGSKTILAVIKNRDAILVFAHVCPLMTTYLKLGLIPRCVEMSRALSNSELTFIRRISALDVNWELDLEKFRSSCQSAVQLNSTMDASAAKPIVTLNEDFELIV